MTSEGWYWLAAGMGWGAVNTGELMAAYPEGPEAVMADLGSDKLDGILTQKQAERLASARPSDYALRVTHAETMGIHTIGYGEEGYPKALRTIHNPPLVLFVKGDASLLNGQLSIGMVGARRPSAYGVEATRAIGRGVALGGAIIVSGLAAGLDAEAHKAALAVNGPTIACIAFGHDNCYPAANKKMMEIIERYGAVVSEYPLGTKPEKPYFLQRNRIIAGLSHGLCVIEARKHSGTMSTVNFAIDFGRDVFAVPGSIFSDLSSGTNAMIKEGAYLAATASDILAVYGVELEGEDPVAAAAKQAAAGRPQAAAAAAPWQQSLRRYTERTREERAAEVAREELPGQQSLGELLRGQLGDYSGQISAAAAIDAFRQLQKTMPPAADSEVDARNRALDAMVDAVSDNVQISSRPPAPKKEETTGGVQPFAWEKVERVSREAMKDEAAKGPKTAPAPPKAEAEKPAKKPGLAARLFGGGDKKQAPAPATENMPTAQVSRGTTVQPVGAVSRVEPVGGPAPVQAVAPLAPAAAAKETQKILTGQAAPPPREPEPPPPTPAADRAERPARDSSLSQRLSTLQKPAATPQRSNAARNTEQAAVKTSFSSGTGQGASSSSAEDSENLLSETAKRALSALGPNPASLSDICQRSGLSSAEAMAALTELELAGLSRQLAGRQFVIMQ